MIGSAAITRSPSRRTTRRSVPCVAGCCGPMLSTMSPVSSSTLTCASARCRYIAGSTSTSGSSPGVGRRGSVFMRLHRPSPELAPEGRPPAPGWWSFGCTPFFLRGTVVAGHRLDVDEPGPRLHFAREQGEVLAQRVALELGRQVDVAQARVAGELEAVHLPALALVPVGTGIDGDPRLDDRFGLVDVGLQREAEVLARRLHVREHLEATVGTGEAVRGLARLHRRRRV